MEITGQSEKNYNFNGVLIDTNIKTTEFYNKPSLIVISYFDETFPVGVVNYVLKHFKITTEKEMKNLISTTTDFFKTNLREIAPDKQPNYIGYYLNEDLMSAYIDIINGKEYQSTFKIL
ncbi:hypothetical protein [uncultured Chryseobacterium sp.]|uniref:hypothetical protein n=1 Tax=uncultured Chryseobacterium sp. TaxID=259322 RepID=UPI0025EAA622|nr:hypothetical protein [uncultured Chryseobacterium sp.]